MTGSRERLVVVGNGMVGLRFLEELLDRAPGRYDITVIGAESEPAYNRVLLSSLLAGEIGEASVRLRNRAWYAERGVRLITGNPATALIPERRTVTLRSGAPILYDICVLATGSEPIQLAVPGNSLDGVETFRTIADARTLQAADAKHPVVVGGGLLGIEAAHGLARDGRTVTLVHVMDRLMERQLDEEAASLLRASLAARGITVLLGERTTALAGRDRVETVVLGASRSIACDLCIVAIGVRAAAALAKAGGLAVGRGVVVDDRLETSVPGIFAIGECAEHREVCYGLVEPGFEQANVLSRVLAGEAASYQGSIRATHLKVSGIPLFSMGEFEAHDAETITLRDRGAGIYRRFVIRDGRLVGAVLFGDTADAPWYCDLVRAGTSIAHIREDLPFGRAYAEAA